jgi:hypothetical protein
MQHVDCIVEKFTANNDFRLLIAEENSLENVWGHFAPVIGRTLAVRKEMGFFWKNLREEYGHEGGIELHVRRITAFSLPERKFVMGSLEFRRKGESVVLYYSPHLENWVLHSPNACAQERYGRIAAGCKSEAACVYEVYREMWSHGVYRFPSQHLKRAGETP